jgi:hypothetical protein
MERLQKLQYLQETLAQQFFGRANEEMIFVEELVRWMGEKDFNDFYDSFCSNWEIVKEDEL